MFLFVGYLLWRAISYMHKQHTSMYTYAFAFIHTFSLTPMHPSNCCIFSKCIHYTRIYFYGIRRICKPYFIMTVTQSIEIQLSQLSANLLSWPQKNMQNVSNDRNIQMTDTILSNSHKKTKTSFTQHLQQYRNVLNANTQSIRTCG